MRAFQLIGVGGGEGVDVSAPKQEEYLPVKVRGETSLLIISSLF